jgi:prepilin-type N-terminal cleavage/methylation domain-containing protein
MSCPPSLEIDVKRHVSNPAFTLIEVLLVIIILGILTTIAVPRFFSHSDLAEEKTESTFVSNLRVGIHQFSADLYLAVGKKTFPIRSSPLFSRVLDEIPENWFYEEVFGRILHNRGDGTTREWYYWVNSDSTEFGIDTTFGAGDETAQITICHIPPGNPDNPQTITIAQSAWPAHQAHGDYLGTCN